MSEMLVEYAATRDPGLRELLVEKHLPLVKFVARRLSSNLPGNVEHGDLVAWGSIGLLDAIEKFDPGRGHQFSTYAVTRIRGEILDGLQKLEWAPKQLTSRIRAMRRTESALATLLGRNPTDAEIADHPDLKDATATEVRSLKQADELTRVKSISAADDGYGGDNSTGGRNTSEQMMLAVEAEQEVAGEAAEIRARMATALSTLSDKERQVVLLYYRDSLTLREIATELGVSVSSATQTHTRLIEGVRSRLSAYGAVA